MTFRRCAHESIVRNFDHQTIGPRQHYAAIRHHLLLDPPAETTSNAECDRPHGSKDQDDRPQQRRHHKRTHEQSNPSDHAIGKSRWMPAVAIKDHRLGVCERRSHQPNLAQRVASG